METPPHKNPTAYKSLLPQRLGGNLLRMKEGHRGSASDIYEQGRKNVRDGVPAYGVVPRHGMFKLKMIAVDPRPYGSTPTHPSNPYSFQILIL